MANLNKSWILCLTVECFDSYKNGMLNLHEGFITKILNNKYLKELQFKLIAVPAKQKKISLINSQLDFVNLNEKDYLFEGDYLYLILTVNKDFDDEKTHKKVWDLFLKLTPGEEYSPTINVYGNTWPCYDMNTIVVQGYDSSGFEEGYFSDDFSDDFSLTLSDLPKSVEDAFGESLNIYKS